MSLWVHICVSLCIHLVWNSFCASWTCMPISFARLQRFSAIISSNRFSVPSSFSFFQEPYNANDSMLDVILCVPAQLLSCVQLFATQWTVACQTSLSMGLAWQENWSGLPLPTQGALPDPWIKPASPALAGGLFTTEPPGKPPLRNPLNYPHFLKIFFFVLFCWSNFHYPVFQIADRFFYLL